MAKNKTILITGGAKRIGLAICRYLHDRGYNLIVTYNQSSKEAKALKKELNKSRASSCDIVKMNFTGSTNFSQFYKKIMQSFGRVDVLINNASKFYPTNATTNSKNGVSDISKIFKLLEILEEENNPLLIHGEKIADNIDIFDREKYFIDDELNTIRKKFPFLKIVLEHVSTSYGVKYIKENNNISGTITPHHMLLTKKDVFLEQKINPHHFCMPVVKNESDLIELRKAACCDNLKFFIGTDSAPHPIHEKKPNMSSKPGIFSAPCSIELYAEIFDQENAISKLEIFSSINGAKFYNLPINNSKIKLEKKEWIMPELSTYKDIQVKNFYANKKINWKVVH